MTLGGANFFNYRFYSNSPPTAFNFFQGRLWATHRLTLGLADDTCYDEGFGCPSPAALNYDVIEQLGPPITFLAIDGVMETTVGGSSFSGPLSGSMTLLDGALRKIAQCSATDHQMVFTRETTQTTRAPSRPPSTPVSSRHAMRPK